MADKLQGHARSIGRYYASTDLDGGTQAIPVSTATVVALSRASINVGAFFNTTTYRLTPPIGYYEAAFGFLFSGVVDGDDFTVSLRKNGTTVRKITETGAQATFCAMAGVIPFEQTVATDYWDLTVTVDPSSGTSDRSIAASNPDNWVIWRQQ